MSNPTSNFGWQMPTPTDLVTDLPADFEVFGQAVDTSMADLKGGTTGQILSKNSNTDMDFIWIANDQGDITGVTATSPLTGGGTSGAITVGIQAASTTQSGAVQLTDSTSSTSTTTAATPNSVKSSYDLANTANTTANTANSTANAAVPKSTVTTKGDLIGATGSATVSRLGVGTNGQTLVAASGETTGMKWAYQPAIIGASIYGTGQSIANSTNTIVLFPNERFDTNNFHSTTTNTGRFTIPTGFDGWYQIAARFRWDQNINGNRNLLIRKNGNDYAVAGGIIGSNNTYTGQAVSSLEYCVAGDYFDVQVTQSSGGNLTLFTDTANGEFSIYMVGGA